MPIKFCSEAYFLNKNTPEILIKISSLNWITYVNMVYIYTYIQFYTVAQLLIENDGIAFDWRPQYTCPKAKVNDHPANIEVNGVLGGDTTTFLA